MSILMTLRIALKALARNKMRTALTMLGMIIGVGAVITMVALGKGAQSTIEEQGKAAGTNLIKINKMRTALTMLGMIIGVGAVITMVALGKGAQSTIEEQVKAAGTNLININSGNFSQGGVRMGGG